MTVRLTTIVFALFLAVPIAEAQQEPIRFVIDSHCDPIPNVASDSMKMDIYEEWVDNLNWLLDQLEPIGAELSFLSAGQWMEVLVNDGPAGSGAAVLQRIWANGGQIAPHSHQEIRAGPLDWPDLPATATLAQCQQSWQDNIDWVEAGILTAFPGPGPLPEPLGDMMNVRGSHLPKNEADYHTLMSLFGITVRQPGPEEDYYAWYGHYIWNPFRPSPSNYMGEDLSAPFVAITQGTTIGIAGVHHGVFQDMTLPAAKVQFLNCYLNWRHAERTGAPAKMWSFGWGSHPTEFDPGDPSRPALVDMLAWIETHFAHRIEPTGTKTMIYDTHRGVAEAYFDWEAVNPGVSSFSFDSLQVKWSEYPYLRPVAEELSGFRCIADLSLGTGIDAFLLGKGPLRAVLLWSDTATGTVDLSSFVGPKVRVVNLETGLLTGISAASVGVGAAPFLVTEEFPECTVTGTPSLGGSVDVSVSGPPGAQAVLLFSLAPALQHLPHYGTLLLDPTAFFTVLSVGSVGPGPSMTQTLPIPNNGGLLGLSVWFQGAVFSFENASAKLTLSAPSITIQP